MIFSSWGFDRGGSSFLHLDKGSIRGWRANVDHNEAMRLGREKWYTEYRVRIARVEREYGA